MVSVWTIKEWHDPYLPALLRDLRRRPSVTVTTPGVHAEHVERAPGGLVEGDAGRGRRRVRVERARPVELAVPDDHATELEHDPLEVLDGGCPARRGPGDALRDEPRRAGGPGRGEEVVGALDPDAGVAVPVPGQVGGIIW